MGCYMFSGSKPRLTASGRVKRLRRSVRAVVVSAALFAAACRRDVTDPILGQPDKSSAASPSAPASSCATCLYGPVTFTRNNGSPQSNYVPIQGDPAADYLIDIDDNASRGADASVVLDGVVLLAPLASGESGPRHVRLNIKVTGQSVLIVQLTGKPASTLT